MNQEMLGSPSIESTTHDFTLIFDSVTALKLETILQEPIAALYMSKEDGSCHPVPRPLKLRPPIATYPSGGTGYFSSPCYAPADIGSSTISSG